MTEPVHSDQHAASQRPTGVISIRGLISLAFSLVGLAFIAWMMFVHPDHQSLYGPAPGTRVAAAAHAPPPHSVGG